MELFDDMNDNGRLIGMNSGLDGLKQRRLNDIYWGIRFATVVYCASEVENELGEKDMKSCAPAAIEKVVNTSGLYEIA